MKGIYLLDSVNIGGTEVLGLDVCRNARANGLDLTFITTRGGELEEQYRESGVEFVRLQRRFPIDPVVVVKLLKVIKRNKIQVIHTHQAVEGIHAYLAALMTNAKVVLSHHGFVADEKNRRALRFLIPRVAKNVYVSEGLRDWYLKEGNLDANIRPTVIYNGIDEARLRYSGESLKPSLGLPDDTVLFGMIANFYASPRKDQKTVCKAFAKIIEQKANAHLLFVGRVEAGAEGKYAECVDFCNKNGLSERVSFLGLRTDIPKILYSLDVFVLSSIQEGLGIAAVEAMLTKTPCILSDIKPFLEVSRDGEVAEIFRTGDDRSLTEIMTRMIEKPARRDDLAERAYRFARDRFSIEAHLKALLELYGGIVST